VARVEHRHVVRGPVTVTGAVHRQHAGEAEERAGGHDPPERGLGQEARQAAEHGSDHHRVDEAVGMVCHDERRSARREQPLPTDDLDRPVEAEHQPRRHDPERPVDGAPEHARCSRRIDRGLGGVDPRDRRDRGHRVPGGVELVPRIGIAQRTALVAGRPHGQRRRDEHEQRQRPDAGQSSPPSGEGTDDHHHDGGTGERVGRGRKDQPRSGPDHGPDGQPDQRSTIGCAGEPSGVPAGDVGEQADQRHVMDELAPVTGRAVVQQAADALERDDRREGGDRSREAPADDLPCQDATRSEERE
jgi:hypothetical protein